jgi:hypothetical protein
MGNQNGKKMTYFETTCETFSQSPMITITLVKKMAHSALKWLIYDLVVINPASIQKITNLILNTRFTNINFKN